MFRIRCTQHIEAIRAGKKTTTIRLWFWKPKPIVSSAICLEEVGTDSPIAYGICRLVLPVILTRDRRFYLGGKLLGPEALLAVAIEDGFDNLEDFWAFFLAQLDKKEMADASAGIMIGWAPIEKEDLPPWA